MCSFAGQNSFGGKMMDPEEGNLFDIPDYEHIQDEEFQPLPPPSSPGGEDEEGVLVICSANLAARLACLLHTFIETLCNFEKCPFCKEGGFEFLCMFCVLHSNSV